MKIIKDFYWFWYDWYEDSTLLTWKPTIYFKSKEYSGIMSSQKRNNKKYLWYLHLWNKWRILSRDLDEQKIFNAQDYYYIRKTKWKDWQ